VSKVESLTAGTSSIFCDVAAAAAESVALRARRLPQLVGASHVVGVETFFDIGCHWRPLNDAAVRVMADDFVYIVW
jgi:hypothetical protein